jgi:serine/threonine protein kinase
LGLDSPLFSSHFSSLLFSVARAGATPDPGSSKYEYEYEEEACIGSGSFGEVFRVRGRRDQQLYAIKKSKPFTGKADKSVPPPSLLSLFVCFRFLSFLARTQRQLLIGGPLP